MLKYHGRNKPVEDERLYFKVAEVTAGWSAAALANLMNEAAILTVRAAAAAVLGFIGCSWRVAAVGCCLDVSLQQPQSRQQQSAQDTL
jgi:hypothetical protein